MRLSPPAPRLPMCAQLISLLLALYQQCNSRRKRSLMLDQMKGLINY
jgi:hypothetical protein